MKFEMEPQFLENNENRIILTLKGIDVDAITTKYRNGGYMSITMPRNKVVVTGKKQSSMSLPGTDPTTDDTFIVRTNCKGSTTYVTTGCGAYRSYFKNGKPLLGGKCYWCWDDFSHDRMGIVTSLIQDESTNNQYCVYWEGCNCGFRCAFAEAELLSADSVNGDKYKDAMDNLRQLFEKCYPGKTLVAAPSYFLFKSRGGCIDPKTYDSYVFIPQPDIITIPIKRVFEMRKTNIEKENIMDISPKEKEEKMKNKPKKESSKHKKSSAEIES